MPATQEVEKIKKIALIAGGGMLPRSIIADCAKRGIEVFIVGFEGQTPRELVEDSPHLWTHLGAVGQVINVLKEQGIKDLVMAGGMKRPSLLELRPDFKALKILGKIGFGALGDDGLLKLLKAELENEGFAIHGVQKFSQHLIAAEGLLGKTKPLKEDEQTVDLGVKVSQAIGALDIGQAVIVQQGLVIGVEAIEGTDSLIERCGGLLRTGRGGILVKTCKPQQDRSMDLPTIGSETIELANKYGLCGIIIQAGHSIILDTKSVADKADAYNMFILGIKV